jgi:hypothetical protein
MCKHTQDAVQAASSVMVQTQPLTLFRLVVCVLYWACMYWGRLLSCRCRQHCKFEYLLVYMPLLVLLLLLL